MMFFKSIIQFQFHNGTINTNLDISEVVNTNCFNSTTVQLIRNRELLSITFF